MAADALRGEGDMNEDALRRAGESGLFKEVLAIELAETPVVLHTSDALSVDPYGNFVCERSQDA